ncbi:MAG: FKBP-type peptidyl-prolyl cis-trans isomerase [Vicinamibacteria bacterium]|nr:FKBP-type peptidyl-prolyl cis-trans isomerase [Vicinamibacteria bacterium]
MLTIRRTLPFALVLAVAACQQKPAEPAAAPQVSPLQTDDQKTLYTVGQMLGRNLAPFKLTPEELQIVKLGVDDAVAGKPPAVPIEQYGPRIQQMLQARSAASAVDNKAKGAEFAKAAAAEAGARTLPSGVVIRTLTPGTGAKPSGPGATVKVHYRGTLTDGKEFDSSIARGEPVEFPLAGVVPCWTQGVAEMQVGEKARLVCPSDTAYRDEGRPPTIPPGATLVFEIELLAVK